MYPIIIARSLWPSTARGKPLALAWGFAALFAALVLAAPALRLSLGSNVYYFAVPWPVVQVIMWCMSFCLVRATGDRTDVARYIATMMLAGAVINVYMVLMSRIVTRRALAKPVQLLLTRLVFHTAIWETVVLFFSHFARFVGSVAPLATSPLYLWPFMYKAIYGRFLLATLDTAGSVAVLNLIVAFIGLATRVASRSTGKRSRAIPRLRRRARPSARSLSWPRCAAFCAPRRSSRLAGCRVSSEVEGWR